MPTTGEMLIAASLFLLVFVLLWRRRRSDRWQEANRCYQCGASLAWGYRTVRLTSEGSSDPVDFCVRCARHRRIWGWLVAVLIALLLGLMAVGVYWQGPVE